MCILIKNINTLVTMDNARRILHNIDLLINNNIVTRIEKDIQIDYNMDNIRIIDGCNKVVYPGFINTHHHFYQSITRNIPFVQNVKLFDWLINLYEIWRELDKDFVRIGAQIAIGELLLSGCTTSTDHYYVFPNKASNNLLDVEIEIAAKMGIRFYPNRGSMSMGQSQGGLPPDDVTQTNEKILLDCERIVSKYHNNNKYSMCKVIVSPCSPFSIDKQLLKETAKFARKHNIIMHTHLCETIDEEQYCVDKMGKRPLQYMEECDWLGNNVYFAHGIYFNTDEINVLAKTKTGISHCPGSNMRLGSGVCRVRDMLDAGVNVNISVDGSSSNDSGNYVREMQLALLIHRLRSVKEMPVKDILEMATIHGSKILNTPEIGCLKINSAADLGIFNLRKIDYAGAMSDPASAIIMCGSGAKTDYTIVNGKIVVENGKLVNCDEEKIFDESAKMTKKIIEITSKKTGIDYYKNI